MRVLVDAAVVARPYVVMGAGVRQTKILLSPSTLTRLPLLEVAPLTFEPQSQ
jgi:prolyl-tRNA editing enzyme YbaK/EbsC (Cys-tRNA(Pro) deacylase)